MSWAETIRTGLEAVRSHRLRSGLTMLGILIGIASVILTVGLGEGAQAQVSSAINSLGSNLLIVAPGSSTSSTGIRGGSGSASTLTVRDATALSSRTVAPDIAAVAPASQRSEPLVAGSANWTTTVVGTMPEWLPVRARSVNDGRFLSAADVTSHAAVTVLGSTTADQLFAGREPVGRSVTVAGVPMTVIRVPAPPGAAAAAAKTLSAAYQEATAELLALHNIASPAGADFTIASQQSILATATSVDKTLTVLLAGVAAISLLVGGIGVMNIMLVSITERVREIGLRKALGATPQVIRRQFLVEASVLGLAGGLLGAALGVVGAVALPHLIAQHISVSPTATVGAVVVAIAIGVVFGVYPASRAARLAG